MYFKIYTYCWPFKPPWFNQSYTCDHCELILIKEKQAAHCNDKKLYITMNNIPAAYYSGKRTMLWDAIPGWDEQVRPSTPVYVYIQWI